MTDVGDEMWWWQNLYVDERFGCHQHPGLDGEQAIPISSFSTSLTDFRWTRDKRNKIEKYYIKNASSNVYRCLVWVFGATIWYFLGGVVLLQHQTFPSSTVISSRNSSSNIEWSIVWYLIIEKSNNCTIIKNFYEILKKNDQSIRRKKSTRKNKVSGDGDNTRKCTGKFLLYVFYQCVF